MTSSPEALVDPSVSRAKFDRELAEYRGMEDTHIRKGWWMVKADFPDIFVVFGTPHMRPAAAAFGVLLNFTNYDLWPPLVRLVDPFTLVPYKWEELPTHLLRRQAATPAEDGGPANTPPAVPQGAAKALSPQPMMMPNPPDGEPFLCLPGTRKYHDHPSHSGDSWLLHRGRGEGTLYFLLNTLYTYGVMPLVFNIEFRLIAQLQRIPE